MPAVSVIILVYKVEKYIEQCARALFEQTLEDLEYVFVDDCTPDASMDILERVLMDYPSRRSQVKILHNEVNCGQAYSRRRGVEVATGDYIIHCDSDDWPETEMYAKMYAKATGEKLDMVICSVCRAYPDHTEPIPGVSHAEDILEALLYQDLYHYLVNKLIARKAYNSLLIWPRENICEDTVLIVQLAYYCRNWGFINEILYNYRYVPDSITSLKNTIDKVEMLRVNVDLAISFIVGRGLSEKYKCAIMHLKCWTKNVAFTLPREYYLQLYPEANIPFFFDRRFTVVERLGHLTKMMGIHGISKLFIRKK